MLQPRLQPRPGLSGTEMQSLISVLLYGIKPVHVNRRKALSRYEQAFAGEVLSTDDVARAISIKNECAYKVLSKYERMGLVSKVGTTKGRSGAMILWEWNSR